MRTHWTPLVLTAVYLGTRLFRLDLLPLFGDEATYITWGLRALHAGSAQDWLASVEDGKQPLFAWLLPPLLAVVPDRLIAARLASVLAGLGTMAVLARLGHRLFGAPSGWVAAALYALAPVALIHDRMALYDSVVTLASLLVLWATLSWAERPRPKESVVLGLTMGTALLTKSSALFLLALVPAVAVVWRRHATRGWWLLAPAYGLAALVYSVVYLSPFAYRIVEGNARYSLTLGELWRLPLELWERNARFVFILATTYLGWPLTLIAGATLAWGTIRGGRGDRVAALWALVPLLGLVAAAKLFYPRYAAFCLVAALLPAARGLVWAAGAALPGPRGPAWRAAHAAAAGALGLAALTPGAAFTAALLTDPRSAPWVDAKDHRSDRWQYVQGDESGYGLPEIVDHLRARAAEGPIAVLASDLTGMPRDGLTASLLGHPAVELGFIMNGPAPDGSVHENESIEQRLGRVPDGVHRLAAAGADVYYVLSSAPDGGKERRFRALNPGLLPLLTVSKPDGRSRFQLYRTRWLDPASTVWLDPAPRLGTGILLRGFTLPERTVKPGGRLRLILHWEAVESSPGGARDLHVFNHVVPDASTQADRIWGQRDGVPMGGGLPTRLWRAGERLADAHTVEISLRTPPGSYEVLTGMYESSTLRRLPVTDRTGVPGGSGDRIVLGRITVEEP